MYNDEKIFKSIEAGADGHLLKEINPQELYNSIQEMLSGGVWMTPLIALKTLKLLRVSSSFRNGRRKKEKITLTAERIQVLEQLSKRIKKYDAYCRKSYPFLRGTIRKHVENIYAKLQVHNKLEAVQIAKRNKLI